MFVSMKAMLFLRAVSGSGKSTLASVLSEDGRYPIFEADQYFYDEAGNYNFDASKLGDAHKDCQSRVVDAMREGVDKVIVSNTSTREQDVQLYKGLAEAEGYTFFSMVVENRHGGKSIHAVPTESIIRQYNGLSKSIKLYNGI